MAVGAHGGGGAVGAVGDGARAGEAVGDVDVKPGHAGGAADGGAEEAVERARQTLLAGCIIVKPCVAGGASGGRHAGGAVGNAGRTSQHPVNKEPH